MAEGRCSRRRQDLHKRSCSQSSCSHSAEAWQTKTNLEAGAPPGDSSECFTVMHGALAGWESSGLTSEVMLQDSVDASQPQPDATGGAENGIKRSRGDSSQQNGSQANAHTGTTPTAEQPSQADAASAQRTRQVNGLHRPGGAAHPQQPVTGGRHTSSGQPSHLPPAAHMPQNGAQDPAEELRQLKQKIAAREARLQRERVSTHGSFPCMMC